MLFFFFFFFFHYFFLLFVRIPFIPFFFNILQKRSSLGKRCKGNKIKINMFIIFLDTFDLFSISFSLNSWAPRAFSLIPLRCKFLIHIQFRREEMIWISLKFFCSSPTLLYTRFELLSFYLLLDF